MKNKKKIAILGSTGSIGKSLLKIIKRKKNNFEILLLTANKNYLELLKQTKNFSVKNVIISDRNCFIKFKKINKNKQIKIYNNYNHLNSIFKKKADYTMSAIVGIEGLDPTLKIIKYSKKIAIANKESIICGWNLLKKNFKKYKTMFVPVDSEHFSIWYALQNKSIENINKIFITASGGPLLRLPKKKIQMIKMKDVLNHPNWKMGKKITIDSSTMMNKVFELIEAKNIFNIDFDKLKIVIHPKSYIHAIISFKDGMINLIAHETTMDIPIFNSIYDSKEYFNNLNKINIKKLNNLELIRVDKTKFPLIKVLNYIPNEISLFETVLVSANDELVRLYLNKKIQYSEIASKLLKVLSLNEFAKYKKLKPRNISDIINLDKHVRLKINSKSVYN